MADSAQANLDRFVQAQTGTFERATLFARVTPAGSVFERMLDKYFGGEPDPLTLALL